jgi:hypothetical protein
MKAGSDQPMPLSVIVAGVEAAHDNAAQLVVEADALGSCQHWARAFALTHFARRNLRRFLFSSSPESVAKRVRKSSGTRCAPF